MDEQRAEAVRGWDSRAAGEGHTGLRQLADADFSGAVEGGRTTALLTNGRVVLLSGGDLDDLAGARLTAYEAPDDALPLLFAMQERGGETRARYYTEETSLSDVNRTLEEGGFTGYVELSENVLSGDYYVVYHGGRSSSVAFVGNSRRLLTGDEAFERAADEVGIYAVVDAPVEVVDLPDGPTGAGGTDRDGDATAAGGAVAAGNPEPTDEEPSPSDATADAPDVDADAPDVDADGAGTLDPSPGDADREAGSDPDAAGGGTPGDVEADEERRTGADGRDDRSDDTGFGGTEEIRVGAGLGTPDRDAEEPSGGDDPVEPDESAADPSPADALEPDESDPPEPTPADALEPDTNDPPEPTPADALEPDESAGDGDTASAGDGGTTTEPSDDGADETTATPAAAGATDGEAAAGRTDPADGATGTGASSDRIAELEARRDRLEADLAEARAELDRVREERDNHRAEAERLRDRVATLEARVEELEEADAAGEEATAGPSLSPAEALDGTNLFVRYRSKGEPTLEAASRGEADREAVNDNLRIEHHTTFETEGATVEGRPFDAFLRDTLAYRFVRWTVRDLLYELRATGNRREMGELHDALPNVDRIELGGEVRIGGSGRSDDESADTREFDVVFRDRMSAPLAVANLHESRTPASGELVETLIDDAKAVAGVAETIGTAFAVTTSYYEPPAHETADAATGGGFLSRNRQKSYVKLDRSRGFHLCLVEARDGEFNLNVPEL